MSKLSEEQIPSFVTKAVAGDERAFEALRQQYRSGLRGYILSRALRPISGDDLDDIEQQIWLAVFQALSEYDAQKGSFYAFVKNRVAKWEVLHWNPNQRLTWLEDQDEDVRDSLLTDAESDPAKLQELETMERIRVDAFHLLTRVLFLCGGYPHQQLSFAFLKLIYAGGQKAQGSAAQVVDNHADKELGDLAREFVIHYRKLSGLTDSEMARSITSLLPLKDRLALKVGELMASDKASSQQSEHLAETVIGETRLSDYFSENGQKPTAAVSDWSYGVQKRIMSVVSEGSEGKACVRCKLRTAAPCGDQDNPLRDVFKSDVETGFAREWLTGAN